MRSSREELGNACSVEPGLCETERRAKTCECMSDQLIEIANLIDGLPDPPAPTTTASYSWSMIGYLLPIKGETSFARRLPDGVMIRLTGVVQEKLRAEAFRVVEAANRRSPEDNMVTICADAV